VYREGLPAAGRCIVVTVESRPSEVQTDIFYKFNSFIHGVINKELNRSNVILRKKERKICFSITSFKIR